MTGAPGGAVPDALYKVSSLRDKCFVCICEDVTDKDVSRAIREGFDSLELAKRYTTVTMGPCQGRLCQNAANRLYAAKTKTDPAAVGTTTARPPWAPVELALLAGRHHEPQRRSALQLIAQASLSARRPSKRFSSAVRLGISPRCWCTKLMRCLRNSPGASGSATSAP